MTVILQMVVGNDFFLNINIQNVFCLNILEVCSYGCNENESAMVQK